MAEFTEMRNNALPYPVYGLPFVVTFPLLDADGDPISPSTPDSEISKNGDTFADCTNEAVEIATSSGICYLSLTGTELTTDVATVRIQSTGAKTTVLSLYPRKLVSIRTGTSASGGVSTSTIVLDGSASAVDDFYNGMIVAAVIDGTTEVRMITDYTGSNQTATVTPDWNTAPDNNDTFTIYRPDGVQIQQANTSHIEGTDATDQIDARLAAINLDQLVKNAVTVDFATTVHHNSVIGHLASDGLGLDTGTGSGYNRATDSLEALRDQGDSAWITATGFSTHTAADVWAVASRVLTAGTNIQLPANGLANVTAWTVDITGDITGNLSGSVGSVTGNIGGNVTGSIGSLAAQAKADVNAEADTALSDINLDQLVKNAVTVDFATTVHHNSVVGHLASDGLGLDTGTGSGYNRATDSLEALRDQGDVAWVTATGFSTLDAAGVRSAVGLASANLDTQLGAIAGYIDTEVAAIKAKTDNLPASPAAVGSAMTLDLTQTIGNSQTQGTVGDALLAAEAQGVGKWTIVGTTLTLYRHDGTTVVRTFTLDDATTPTSRT